MFHKVTSWFFLGLFAVWEKTTFKPTEEIHNCSLHVSLPVDGVCRWWWKCNPLHGFPNIILCLLVVLALPRTYTFAFIGREFFSFWSSVRLFNLSLGHLCTEFVYLFVLCPLCHISVPYCIQQMAREFNTRFFSNSIFYGQIMHKHSPEHYEELCRFCLSSFHSLRFTGSLPTTFSKISSFTLYMPVFP